jgi:predicted porin
MRVGRLPLPTFIDSENHDIGYSFVWANPPVDLYQLSIHSTDGVDASYRSEIGGSVNSVRFIYGNKSTSKDMWGVFDTLEYGSALFHAGYQERRSLVSNLLTGVPEAWVGSSDLTLGASYDPGDWFLMSEWIQRRTTTKLSSMYVSGGYRIGKFTPYLTYSQIGQASFLSGFAAPTATAIQLANRSQSTVSVGTRWDFTRKADLKIQYDRVKLGDNSNGYLINVPPGVTLNGSSFDVITVVVDFVF